MHNPTGDFFLRLSCVLKRIPVSKSSWYAGIKSGIYPAPTKIGRRTSAWPNSEIEALQQSLRGRLHCP